MRVVARRCVYYRPLYFGARTSRSKLSLFFYVMDLGPLLAHQLDDGLIHPHPGTDVSDKSGSKNFLSLIYFNTIK